MSDPRFEISKQQYDSFGAALLQAADITRRHITNCQDQGFSVEEKSDGSLVTQVDKECEEKVRALIQEQFPEHGFLGEEYGHTKSSAPFQWVIDPIDGTADFTRGMAQFGTVLGLFLNHRPICGILDFPGQNLRIWAVYRRGLKKEGRFNAPSLVRPKPIIALPPKSAAKRSLGTDTFLSDVQQLYPDYRTFWTCLSDAHESTGALDCSVELNCKIWDVASAEILATEGGKAFAWLEPPTPWATGRCSSALGEPRIVEELVQLWKRTDTKI